MSLPIRVTLVGLLLTSGPAWAAEGDTAPEAEETSSQKTPEAEESDGGTQPADPTAQSAPAPPAATQDEEPIFVTLARDPYAKRYGRPPGEGWIPMPGTKTELRFGGFIQLNLIHDFQNAGFPYGWFVPALIPVPTSSTPNTEFDPRTSRVTFETRTNTAEAGSVRTTVDMDFYGDLSASFIKPRLRQAYVTWVGPRSNISFSVGQTWSTYLDLQVWPEIFDLQGPNAMTGARQGLVRGSYAFGKEKNTIFDLAVEQPTTAVSDGTGLKQSPDFVARLSWQKGWGHLQGAAIGRQLVAESSEGGGRDSAFGWGVSFSGSLKIPGTKRKGALHDDLGERQDSLQFQVQGGSGSGRYVFDLGSAPRGQDAVYDDATQELVTLDNVGGLVAYHRWWTDRLRTAIVYGVARVDNLAIQGPDDLERTTYFLVNLAYRAFPRMDIGAEYTWGERRNQDGQKGHANRLLLGLNFGF